MRRTILWSKKGNEWVIYSSPEKTKCIRKTDKKKIEIEKQTAASAINNFEASELNFNPAFFNHPKGKTV